MRVPAQELAHQLPRRGTEKTLAEEISVMETEYRMAGG
jgi:hypothetical protein